ncbi:MAG: DoxX family protein [Gemmatimonadota bacterium]
MATARGETASGRAADEAPDDGMGAVRAPSVDRSLDRPAGPALDRPPEAASEWSARGIAILRITIGVVFVAHGIQKAVLWGVVGGVPFFREAGIPFATVAAPLVMVVESLAGLALLVGYRARLAAALLAVVALTALVTVHLPYGFFMPSGIEFVLVLAAANVALALAGPGAWAVDGMRGRRGSVAD